MIFSSVEQLSRFYKRHCRLRVYVQKVRWVKGLHTGTSDLANCHPPPSNGSQENFREGLRDPRTPNKKYKFRRKLGKEPSR